MTPPGAQADDLGEDVNDGFFSVAVAYSNAFRYAETEALNGGPGPQTRERLERHRTELLRIHRLGLRRRMGLPYELVAAARIADIVTAQARYIDELDVRASIGSLARGKRRNALAFENGPDHLGAAIRINHGHPRPLQANPTGGATTNTVDADHVMPTRDGDDDQRPNVELHERFHAVLDVDGTRLTTEMDEEPNQPLSPADRPDRSQWLNNAAVTARQNIERGHQRVRRMLGRQQPTRRTSVGPVNPVNEDGYTTDRSQTDSTRTNARHNRQRSDGLP